MSAPSITALETGIQFLSRLILYSKPILLHIVPHCTKNVVIRYRLNHVPVYTVVRMVCSFPHCDTECLKDTYIQTFMENAMSAKPHIRCCDPCSSYPLFFFLNDFGDLFIFLRTTSTAYGGFQARGQIGVGAASCHSNVGSEPKL